MPVSAAELAYHWDAARDTKRAVPAWIEAGLAAERTYAFAEARRAYERALELTPLRARPLLGRARAAAATDDPRAARRANGQLGEIWHGADPGLAGLEETAR